MILPVTIEIPKNIFQKMFSLSENHPTIFFYLSEAVRRTFEEKIQLKEFRKSIEFIRFTMVKRGKQTKELQMHFINQKPQHVLTDEEGLLKLRMENFYKFESDKEFVIILLYFFCKNFGITFSLTSDRLFYEKLRCEVTDISKGKKEEVLKYIYLDVSGN